MTRIGQGLLTSGSECRGTLQAVESVQDVLQLIKTDLSHVILLTSSASATTVTPLFSKIRGVLCTSGGPTSHLALVAREFDLPCVMAADLQFHGELNGRAARISSQGEIYLEG